MWHVRGANMRNREIGREGPKKSPGTRLDAFPEDEQDSAFGMISLLVDIDTPAARASPKQIADLGRSPPGHERGEDKVGRRRTPPPRHREMADCAAPICPTGCIPSDP